MFTWKTTWTIAVCCGCWTKIGEQKLRKSPDKYKSKNNGAAVYISILLQWYQLKVPSIVYSEKYITDFCVYVLVSTKCPVIKVGVTGRWPARAFAFAKQSYFQLYKVDELLQVFDIQQSFAIYTGPEKLARAIESAALRKFKRFCVQPPLESQLRSSGVQTSRERFSNEIYTDLVNFLRSSISLNTTETCMNPKSETLSAALDRWLPLLDGANLASWRFIIGVPLGKFHHI